SASVTVYSPYGKSSPSTIAFPSLPVVIVTVVLPSLEVNVYVLSLDGLPPSVTVISTSSHTFGFSFGTMLSETSHSSVTSTVPTSFPSTSVTVYSPFGNSLRSTVTFPSLSVVIVTVVSPSFDVNVYVLSLDGLPSSVTVISTSSHTFGFSFGTTTFLTLSSQSSLYSTSISPRSLPSLSVTLYLPPGKSSRSNVILPFSSVVSVNFSPSSDSNVISSSVTGLPSWSSTSTVNSSQTFGSSSGTITVLTLSSQSSLYSTSISPRSLPSLSVTLYLPSGKSSRSNVILPFSSVVSVNFSPSSDSNVIS